MMEESEILNRKSQKRREIQNNNDDEAKKPGRTLLLKQQTKGFNENLGREKEGKKKDKTIKLVKVVENS